MTRVHFVYQNEALTHCHKLAVNSFWAKRYMVKVAKRFTDNWMKVTCESCMNRPF